MGDGINFDELDKAVAKVMGDSNDTAQPNAPEAQVSPVTTPPAQVNPAPEFPAIEKKPALLPSTPPSAETSGDIQPEATPVSPQVIKKPQPVALKRRGQFMDMKPSSATKKPAQMSLRKTMPVIAPLNAAPKTQPVQSVDEPKPDNIPQPTDTPQSLLEQDTTNPDQTPFLADAKVEKRPLGAAMPQEAVSTPNLEEPEDITLGEQLTPESSSPLPPELQTNVLEAESDITVTEPEPAATPLDEKNTAAFAEALDDTAPAASESPTPQASDTAQKTTAAPQDPGNIQPQYSKKQSVDEPKHAELYHDAHDSTAAHEESHHSFIFYFVMILLFVIIGCGIGVVYYLYSTGSLNLNFL